MSGPRSTWNITTSSARLHSFVHGDELADLADERDDVVVMTADLMTSNRTEDFRRRHPDRFVQVGIAEQNMMGIAAGMASCGYRPYVSTFASFASLLCAEHLRTDLAYTRMPVRVLAHHAGIAMGFYGTSHHALEDIALTRAIAGMTVVAPCDAAMTRAVLRTTIDHEGPVYIRLGRGSEPDVHAVVDELPRGAMVQLRTGGDLAILAVGIGVQAALGAARILADEGVEASVHDVVYLKPLDEDRIAALARTTGRLLTVEEHNVSGGLGTAVAEVVGRNRIDAAVEVHGIPDTFAIVGPPNSLYRHYGLTAEGVADRARGLLAR